MNFVIELHPFYHFDRFLNRAVGLKMTYSSITLNNVYNTKDLRDDGYDLDKSHTGLRRRKGNHNQMYSSLWKNETKFIVKSTVPFSSNLDEVLDLVKDVQRCGADDNPIRWFGAFPGEKLRKAQRIFSACKLNWICLLFYASHLFIL